MAKRLREEGLRRRGETTKGGLKKKIKRGRLYRRRGGSE